MLGGPQKYSVLLIFWSQSLEPALKEGKGSQGQFNLQLPVNPQLVEFVALVIIAIKFMTILKNMGKLLACD